MAGAKFMNEFEAAYGRPTGYVEAPKDVIERLSEIAPQSMQDYWHRFGFSVFQDGWFQLVNPETYAPVLQEWIKDTDLDGRDEYIVVSRGAFGSLKLWGRKTGYDGTITPTSGHMRLAKRNNEKKIAAGQADLWGEAVMSKSALLKYGKPEQKDDIYTRLFEQAKERLGPLGPDQVYGFVPALQLGGEMVAKNLRIEPAPEHLTMLAGISDRAVLRFDDLVKRAFGSDAAVEAANKALGEET